MPTFERRIPEGDTRERLVCPGCGHIDYQNPKIVAGAVVAHRGRVLLCRRAIEPRRGFWSLPAGYMELGETIEEGARREAREETATEIALDGLLAVFSIGRIGQIQIIYRARFADPATPRFAAGVESSDVRLFAWEAIPWDEIAFPTVRWSLDAWRANPDGPLGPPAGIPAENRKGRISR
jgi:ADP-ribose pyrophosphatase YjhB (NUDIX family)